MVKKYYSKRYTRKRRTKRLIIGLILMFTTLVVVSAYTDIPQLEPVRKQIESLKSGMGVSKLAVGESDKIDEFSITVEDVSLAHSINIFFIMNHKLSAPRGAALLLVKIKVENIGQKRELFPPPRDSISLQYSGVDKQYPNMYTNPDLFSPPFYYISETTGKGGINAPLCCNLFGNEKIELYPGIVEKGYFIFEVPEGIEPEGTTFRIKGLVWDFGKKPPITIIPY